MGQGVLYPDPRSLGSMLGTLSVENSDNSVFSRIWAATIHAYGFQRAGFGLNQLLLSMP